MFMHPTLTFTLANEEATAALAQLIARFALTGDLIRLEGDLGAGKTTFAKYVLQTLGHTGEVPSPTYTLVQTYDETRIPVAHVDCYRLKDPQELAGMGLEDYRTHGLILAEWPDQGGPLLRADAPDMLTYHIGEMNNCGTLTVALSPAAQEGARTVTLRASRSWQRRIGFWPRYAPQLAATIPVSLCRPSTEEGRRAFLNKQNLGAYQLENVGGDWSFRSYWRVRLPNGATRMLMDSPPPVEGVTEFAQRAENYRSMGLRAPRIDALDEKNGYLLAEDFGDRSLAKAVAAGTPQEPWYRTAIDALVRECQNVPATVRRYTPTDWWIEAARFTDWYMPMASGHATPPAARAHFQSLWLALWPLMQTMPQGLMMWDCQATNMMLLADEPRLENFGLIDIQDARVAPAVQDMAILLRDDRRGQDDALENAMLAYAAQQFGVPQATLQLGLNVASLHHCCRILGGVSRLIVRDGRTRMSAAVRRRWSIAHQSFACPELAELVAFMQPWEEAGISRADELAAKAA